MICRKQELLAILPSSLREELEGVVWEKVTELRLYRGQPPLICQGDGVFPGGGRVSGEDLRFCVNAASRYSPWNTQSIREGYLTAQGGHRMGLGGQITGETISNVNSLCIRVAKDFPGIARKVEASSSVLIIGPPGSGKTTLLRDLIRHISQTEPVGVVDERGELFPLAGGESIFDLGLMTHVLTGVQKGRGVEMLLRSIGPRWIAVDEITARRDCQGLVQAGWCGIKLLATAHAGNKQDLMEREIYRPLWETGLFSSLVVMARDKSWHQERMEP